ncbi:MAG: SHOCT domain-containing protein [Actinobacteria bacterium]|nr:MAG: SHOCT domain-containing protein [Actinomycetota bacterium]
MTAESLPMRRTAIALVVLASVIGFFAVFAVWAKRQLLETDTWTETSSQLLENKDIQQAVAGFLVDSLYGNVNVEQQLSGVLPPRAKPLAGPAAGGLRQLADRVALEALQRPRVQLAWEKANRSAHATFLGIVEGGNETVSTENGVVTLDLGTLVQRVGGQVGVSAAGRLPPEAAQIEVLRADELSFAQDLVNLLRKLAIVLPAVALALYAVAIYLARGWRRRALRASGFSFIVIGIAVLVARDLAGTAVVDSLTNTAAVEPAASSTWDIGTSLLRDSGTAMIGYGIVIVLGAWLAGPGSVGATARRAITPLLRERGIAYAVLAAIVGLVFWWSPTEGTRRLIPSLVLIALLVAGLEALRWQAIRDFPDETWERRSERWRTSLARVRHRETGASKTVSPEVRLQQLERLAKLSEAGVLSPEELEREKARILASA